MQLTVPSTTTTTTTTTSTTTSTCTTTESVADPVKREKRIVCHDYHDFSQMTTAPCDVPLEPTEKKRGGPRGGVTCPFPERLHMMLASVESTGHSHIVSWCVHGRCFIVHKPKEFVTEVMPTYFRQTKLTSFQRQLNLYGFVRLTTGRDRGGYYHELFLRGRPFLCKRILRTRIKGIGIKAANNPKDEPDFYQMQYVYDLEGTSSVSSPTSTISSPPTTNQIAMAVPQQLPQQQAQTHQQQQVPSSPIPVSVAQHETVQVPQIVSHPPSPVHQSVIATIQQPVATTTTTIVQIPVVAPVPSYYPQPNQPQLQAQPNQPQSATIVTPPQTASAPIQVPPTLTLVPPPPEKDTPLLFEGMLFHYIDPSDFEKGFQNTTAAIVEV